MNRLIAAAAAMLLLATGQAAATMLSPTTRLEARVEG
jgi:hypothetical protein